MGIYVKGMPKPKSCDECPIALWALPKDCNLEIGICPIVEVAEPHGDLVDRDAILYPYADKIEINNADVKWYPYARKEDIDKVPVVIKAEYKC